MMLPILFAVTALWSAHVAASSELLDRNLAYHSPFVGYNEVI
jgi:hypothetical protein